MALLDKNAILCAEDLPAEDVNVPEWGGTVRVRALSGTERDAYEASLVQVDQKNNVRPNLADARAKLVARSLVDEVGNRVFGDGDIKALGRKSAVALDRVYTVALRLSGLTAEDVDELLLNSDSAPSDGSGSDSPES